MGLRFPNLSVIVDKCIPGRGKAKEWCCIDLAREKLFNKKEANSPPAPALREKLFNATEGGKFFAGAAGNKNKKKKTTMQRATLRPFPDMKFPAWKEVEGSNWYVDFLPLAGRNLLRVHDSGRTVLTLGGSGATKALPNLQSPKRSPLALLVPSDDNGIGSILVIERSIVQEAPPGFVFPFIRDTDMEHHHHHQFHHHHQLEALVYCSISESWDSIVLPPPPLGFGIGGSGFFMTNIVKSYAVVPGGGGGSHALCISVDGSGTYCFDMATRAWTKVGDWKLPFIGRAEYVKELKLWFGICHTTNKDKEFRLGAADLSTIAMPMDYHQSPLLRHLQLQIQPQKPLSSSPLLRQLQLQLQSQQSPTPLPQPLQLVGTWNELMDDTTTKGWKEVRCPQFVHLGSGRFCIARSFFFHRAREIREMKEPTRLTFGEDEDELLTTTVFTGADVKPLLQQQASDTTDNQGNLPLQMISHNSIRHVPNEVYGNIQLVF